MGTRIIKRILMTIPTIFIISLVLFALFKWMPSDPVALSMPSYVKADQYELVYEQTKENMGFNDTLPQQYANWIKQMTLGDMGTSLIYKKPVREVIAQPLKHTLILNGVVFLISFGIALALGMYSGLHPHKKADRIWQNVTLLGMSIPSFFLSILLIYIFSFQLHLFPSSGMAGSNASFLEKVRYLCLPVLSMTLLSIAGTYRYIRASMIEIFQSEYMMAAKARGLSKGQQYYHALRNALVPLISIAMNDISTLFFGSVLIESIFAYDGIGRVLLQALQRRDFMLVIALNMIYALVYIVCNFLADILYTIVDPRVAHHE